MIGTAYFKDGHTEEILEATVKDLGLGTQSIEFFTESGRYFYQSWYEFPETLYCDNNPILPSSNFRYKFYKLSFDVGFSIDDDPRYEPRIINVPIEKIELKEKQNGS